MVDERNSEYRYFYRKTFKSIGIPTLIFSIVYFVYLFLTSAMAVVVKNKELKILLSPIKLFIKGEPYYHMWYLYMMIGVYLLVPVVLLFKKSIGERIFNRVAWGFIIWASLSAWTSTNKLHWDIGASFRYMGYFMIGYEIRRLMSNKKDNIKGCALIALGIVTEAIAVFIRYKYALVGIEYSEFKYGLIEPLCPLIVIASVFVFEGFSCLNIKKNLGKLSELTFLIYLFHAGYWDLFSRIIRKIGFEWDNRIVIPVSIIVVFFVSAISAKLYLKIYKAIEEKWKVSDKICRFINL